MITLLNHSRALSNELTDLINEAFNYKPVSEKVQKQTVYYDVVIEKESATITADLPGISKVDLQISVETNGLKVEGKNDKRHYVFKVPSSNEWEFSSTTAQLENGVLTLTVPKKQLQKTLITIQ